MAEPNAASLSWSASDLVGEVVDYAIIGLDAQGTIQSWNLGAVRAKGYTADEAIGQSFAIFCTEEDRRRDLPRQLLAEARDRGRVEHSGWRVRKDGTRFWGDVVITALHDSSGRLTGFTKVTRDLTEQHELQTRLRHSEERLRLLVGQVVDYAIIALDPQGTIETWNLGAERVKGYTADEAIGRPWLMFYTDEDRSAGVPVALLEQARRQGRAEHSGWRVRKDGTRFWADVVITALHDDAGRLTGFAKVTRDRTESKVLENAQRAFYAAFDHDFRTPLTALKGYVEVLRDAPEEARDRLIDRVETNADRLLAMVESLLEFATQRVDRGVLRIGELDVAQVARAVVRDLPPSLDPARVRVADGVAIAFANADAMHRVLTNLVVNALKYSASGTPVDIGFDAPRPDSLRISVRDHGRGIRSQDVDSIFEEFVRGELAEDDGGTGIGLASVRGLVAQQHGAVTIDSEEGVGTSVSVVLTADRSPRAPAPSQRSESSLGALHPAREPAVPAASPSVSNGQPSG